MSVGWIYFNYKQYNWNNHGTNFEEVWEIWMIKSDFTTEIIMKNRQRQKPVSVGVVWKKKTRKGDIYHFCYVNKRSFCIRKTSTKLCFCKKCIIDCHLCHSTKCILSTTDWKQLWPLTWAEMTSYVWVTDCECDIHLRSKQLWKYLTKQILLH